MGEAKEGESWHQEAKIVGGSFLHVRGLASERHLRMSLPIGCLHSNMGKRLKLVSSYYILGHIIYWARPPNEFVVGQGLIFWMSPTDA